MQIRWLVTSHCGHTLSLTQSVYHAVKGVYKEVTWRIRSHVRTSTCHDMPRMQQDLIQMCKNSLHIGILNSYSSRTRRIWADIYNQRGRRPSWLLSVNFQAILVIFSGETSWNRDIFFTEDVAKTFFPTSKISGQEIRHQFFLIWSNLTIMAHIMGLGNQSENWKIIIPS